jgi:hypothetical protein
VKEKKTTPLPHDGPTDPGKKGEETKPSFWKNPKSFGFYALWGGLTLLVVGAVCAVIWWDSIMAWWKGEEAAENGSNEEE